MSWQVCFTALLMLGQPDAPEEAQHPFDEPGRRVDTGSEDSAQPRFVERGIDALELCDRLDRGRPLARRDEDGDVGEPRGRIPLLGVDGLEAGLMRAVPVSPPDVA